MLDTAKFRQEREDVWEKMKTVRDEINALKAKGENTAEKEQELENLDADHIQLDKDIKRVEKMTTLSDLEKEDLLKSKILLSIC